MVSVEDSLLFIPRLNVDIIESLVHIQFCEVSNILKFRHQLRDQ